MQNKYFFTAFSVLVFGIFGLGFFVVVERKEIDFLNKKIEILTQAKPVVTSTSSDYRILTTKNLVWNKQLFQLQHLCKGKSYGANMQRVVDNEYDITVDVQSIGTCIGENQLALITHDDQKIVLQTLDVEDSADAVSLIGYELISENGTLLIKFSSAPFCDGVGCTISPNSVSAVFHLNDLNPMTSYQVLKNFPETGKGDWNSDGTKAVFYPDTMDRDGAYGLSVPTQAEMVAKVQGALIGYDLVADIAVQKNLSDKAAYYYLLDSEDYVLNQNNLMIKFDDKTFLPTWMTCVNPGVPCKSKNLSKWISLDQYEAFIALPDGIVKKVEVKF